MSKKRIWLAVDPGLSGWGWAAFHEPQLEVFFPFPFKHGTVGNAKGKTIPERSKKATEQIQKVLDQWNGRISKVLIEWPETFLGTGRGHTAAAKGDILKLMLSATSILYACQAEGIEVETFDVTVWKGQLSKDQIKWRIAKIQKRHPENLEYKSHAVDAVGIGLHAMGYL